MAADLDLETNIAIPGFNVSSASVSPRLPSGNKMIFLPSAKREQISLNGGVSGS